MPHASLNPFTNQVLSTYRSWDTARLKGALERAHRAQEAWARTDFTVRGDMLREAAKRLLAHRERYATLITLEMGKPVREARAEVEKCALACTYIADNGEFFLDPEQVESEAQTSYVAYYPLGVVLAIMPWNYPFWQVIRFGAGTLMAGNAILLKHSHNVPQCALALEGLFRESGLPEGVFTTLMIETGHTEDVIASPHVHAVSATASEATGRKVAAWAGKNLKKCVLELGGSDPFIVLHDANLDAAVEGAVAARFQNCGQSCIAAKRFIVVREIAEEFVKRLVHRVKALKVGNPMDEATELGPMARADLRDELHEQITDSLTEGAVAVTGCEPANGKGFFYKPSVLDHVNESTRAWHEELFGPVACILRAADEDDAIRIANETRFGLGSSIWSTDRVRAEQLAARIHAGSTFINAQVKSDPRFPFGGVKSSGFGRELSRQGIMEFVNAKTVWIK